MVPPIIVNENGDIQLFRSTEEAGRAMEPIDIRNEEYKAYDAEGYPLRLDIEGNLVVITGRQGDACQKEELERDLRSFLERARTEVPGVGGMQLEDLIRVYVEEFDYAI